MKKIQKKKKIIDSLKKNIKNTISLVKELEQDNRNTEAEILIWNNTTTNE